MITPLFKLTAIGFLVISSSLIGSSVTAETKPKESADALPASITNAESITNTAVIEKSTPEAPLEAEALPDFSGESDLTIHTPKGPSSDLEVNTRAEDWQYLHSGDENSGSVKLKLPID